MAVIQYSALVTQLRGKLGGSQFNKGHAGYSLQRKSTPTIRQTPAQLRQRQIVSQVQRSWKEETEQRKNQAAQAAISNPTYNRLGQQVVLSGYNHYVKMMTWRLMGSPADPINTIAPAILTTPVASAQYYFSSLVMSIGESIRIGYATYTINGVSQISGTPTGTNSYTRGYVYITRVDSQGRRLQGARPVFVCKLQYSSQTVNHNDRPFLTSFYFKSGDYVLFEVRTRNLGAGAETGYWSEVIQLQ